MITIKKEKEIELMRVAGSITAGALDEISKHIKPGISTLELDKIANKFIIDKGAKPAFLRYSGFPNSICASIDDVVVHGIPKQDIVLEEGQIIGIDVGAKFGGYCGDAARTFAVGKISEDKQKLMDVTKECFFRAIKNLKAGSRLGDIGYEVERYAEKFGFKPVRSMGGHGIGKNMHEDPFVPMYGRAGTGMKLEAGMTLAIEPMINMGTYEIDIDGWDVRTADGLPSAHYENTVLIKEDGVEILTKTADLEA
ncbi:MAG: type I methionyl aminopeptidase [Clostridiales bacterium]|nr:type I methionyl aminopeptidase [Clostridiales bacterium]